MSDSTLQQITEHVYWMPPGEPDRPALCAVVGSEMVVMLDGGASSAHARQFLEQIELLGVSRPQRVVLTHSHWDHVFGAERVGAEVVAHRWTAQKLMELSTRSWSDAGLDQQVAQGLESEEVAKNIRVEMPAPRTVRIPKPDRIFGDGLVWSLGGVECRIDHVGGDHAADSSVVFLLPDRVLFLGDCLSNAFRAHQPAYTIGQLIPLLSALESFDAVLYVEGHASRVIGRPEFEGDLLKMRNAAEVIQETGADEDRAFARYKERVGELPDEDAAFFLRALIVGEMKSHGGKGEE